VWTVHLNANGVRAEFTLDVASSLPQVLVEYTPNLPDPQHQGQYISQTITYLYGLGLVGEMKPLAGGLTEYHLTDALGSVRQITHGSSGSVLATQTFDAFGNRFEWARGNVLWDAQSPFGWTGEQSDPNGLVYLRARYYAPSMGRLVGADRSQRSAS
jgi:RHS repeat-associated protein